MKNLFFLFCFLSILAGIISCNGKAAEISSAKSQVCISDSMARMVTIDSVRIQNIDDELKLSGEVSFNDNKVVHVFPISSGQIVSVNVSIGDYVTAGQKLAVMKSADIAGNYADLKTAGADISISRRAMENAKHLYENGIASEKEYLEAKENYDKAVAGERKIATQISINGSGRTSASGLYTIIAPKSGFIVEKNINPGQFIRNDNGQIMFTIGDTRDVWIWANVYESDIARVKEGYRAFVTTLAYPDSVFIGKVDKVNQTLDPQTKVMRIRIMLPNEKRSLKPEMFANITIENKEGKRSMAIPAKALISEDGKNYVIVVHDKCSLEVRPVNILKTSGTIAFIDKGLQPGEQLISTNQILIYRQLQEK